MALVARIVPLLCACLLLLSGCASIERVTDEEDEADEAAETARALAEVETFDVDQYPLEAPERVVDVTHRVPAQLMEVRAAAGVERTVDGYRVQIFSTDDRRAADEVYTEAEEWWASNRAATSCARSLLMPCPRSPRCTSSIVSPCTGCAWATSPRRNRLAS